MFSLSLSELGRIVQEAGTPTEGALASFIWDNLSSHLAPIKGNEAARIYRELGYQPFMGYPLRRLDMAAKPICGTRTGG